MEQFNVTGMSCAACSARVEKAVSKVPGVESVAVSLLTNSMGVTGSASAADIIKAVKDAGYGASAKGGVNADTSGISDDFLTDTETPLLKKRLAGSLVFLLVLMYFSMGHMMLGLPLPSFFNGNHIAVGLAELLLTLIIMVINKKFFISGFSSLWHRAPNMDTLVAMGSSAAFIYSLYALFAMTDAQVSGGSQAAMQWMDEFYFESAAMILTLITIGKTLEAYSKGRTTDAIRSLMYLAPKTAAVIRNGVETEIPVDQVVKGDIFIVRPGSSIPVDGIVIEGSGAVDESALTGESIPVDKEEGMEVSAATVNLSGMLRCQAVRVGQDTALSKIIQMVSDAAATKAPAAKVADKVSGIFVPAVIGLAVLTTAVWLLLGHPAGYALARGISVLVISCPCALGLATPVAIMVGNGLGARNGIMFKTAVSLEETGRIDIIALDKTGTITRGQPLVTDIIPAEGVSEKDLLGMAAALEYGSEHPLGNAVIRYYEETSEGPSAGDLALSHIKDLAVIPGKGLGALYDGKKLTGGSLRFVSEQARVPDKAGEKAAELAEAGRTPLFFACDGGFAGIIAVADMIREESTEAISQLHDMGIRVVMLTGDNEKTARAIGSQAGVDEVYAGVLPDGKESLVRRLQEKGRTAMVGDGINDAPALTRADIGIAIGAGTDIAIEAADVVLMKSSLLDVPAAIRLSRATLRNIHQNLFWAFIYNIIGIPLAMGVYIRAFGWELDPMFGAAAMSLSSFCVVTNALRLNLFRLYDAGRDRRKSGSSGIPEKTGTVEVMQVTDMSGAGPSGHVTKTISIEGMMCHHCEATVKRVLEKIDGIESASADHEKDTAVIELSAEVDDEVITRAIEDKDYKVLSIS